ncbi:PiggyBac transposable element-derived protein 4 [Anthophora plagiata]
MRFNIRTQRKRIKTNRLAPIQNILEIFIQNCQKTYIPFEHLTLDKELIVFRGRCGFRQYIASKSAKYRIKIYTLVDTKTYYTVNLEIYCGKQPENSLYAVSNKPYDAVNRMVNCVSGSSRKITIDNLFTSYETAENLLHNHKLTVVDTLRSNKTCTPLQFKTRRKVKTSLFSFQKYIALVSYMSKPQKMVHVMSTLHHDKEIDTRFGHQNKPSIITFYNETKSGVDVGELARTYDVSRNSKR